MSAVAPDVPCDDLDYVQAYVEGYVAGFERGRDHGVAQAEKALRRFAKLIDSTMPRPSGRAPTDFERGALAVTEQAYRTMLDAADRLAASCKTGGEQ